MKNLIGGTMLFISVGSFLRAAFDHFGWKFWEVFSASQEIKKSVMGEFGFNFFFLNAVAVVGLWLVFSGTKGRNG